jgi:hypothetical protein
MNTATPEKPTLPLEVAASATPEAAPIAGAKPKVELLKMGERGVELTSYEDLYRFAKAVILSGLAPKGFTKPEEVLITVQFGAELGLSPMQALQNISPINGRPCIWGDAVPGLCMKHLEKLTDRMVGAAGSDDLGFEVTALRKGRAEPVVRVFTVAMAKKAGLWGKAGPWSNYPERMLLMRARTYALRDSCPDALKGLLTVEEAKDHPEPINVKNSAKEGLTALTP